MASRYGRNQKQKHLAEIAELKQKIKAREVTINRLEKNLSDANGALKALVENTPSDEWAAIIGGLDNPEAKKLLAWFQKYGEAPVIIPGPAELDPVKYEVYQWNGTGKPLQKR